MFIYFRVPLYILSTFGPARDGLGCVGLGCVTIAIDVVDSEPIYSKLQDGCRTVVFRW